MAAMKEKRGFKRYRNRSSFKVRIKGKVFNAEVTDYSVSGMGLTVQGAPPLRASETIDFSDSPIGHGAQAEVVWASASSPALKVGIKKNGNIKGTLRDYWLSDLLLGLHKDQRHGVLVVKSGESARRVFFEAGAVVSANSTHPADALSLMMLKTKAITRPVYDQVEKAHSESGTSRGNLLVEFGALKPLQLYNATKDMALMIIHRLFALKDNEFEFVEGSLSKMKIFKFKLTVPNLIYRGMKALTDEGRIKGLCPAPETVLAFTPEATGLLIDMNPDPADAKTFSLANGKRTVADIVAASETDELETLRCICAIFGTGTAAEAEQAAPEPKADKTVKAEAGAQEAAQGTASGEAAGENGQQQDAQEQDAPSEPPGEVLPEVAERIEGFYAQLKGFDYYEALSVSKQSTRDEIKKSYYRAAKVFHPDRHHNLNPELWDKVNVIFSFITNAYSTLSSHNSRRDYDSTPSHNHEQSVSGEELARRKYDEGLGEIRRNRPEEAQMLFAEAAYLNTGNPEYHYRHGLSLFALQKYKEAEKSIKRALKKTPDNAEYLVSAAQVYLKLDLPIRAKGNFERALKIQPQNNIALEGLAAMEPKQ